MTHEVETISAHYQRQATPEVWSEVDALRKRVDEQIEIMADLECALVLTREHNPTANVASFVDSSVQFKRLADYLRAHQQDAAQAGEAGTAETTKIGSVHEHVVAASDAPKGD